MRTTMHLYFIDISKPEGAKQWADLKAKLSARTPHRMHALGEYYFPFKDAGESFEVELETEHIFENQWNTGPIAGLTISKAGSGWRVFDWAEQYMPDGMNQNIRMGHYLDETQEMRDIRANTVGCGYCGKQSLAVNGEYPAFCVKCIDSPYLKASELHLLRLRPMNVGFGVNRAPLTEDESAYLLPLYKDAQLHGSTERGKKAIEKARRDILQKRDSIIHAATEEFDGMTWLMDHGIKTDNVIYYSHTQTFGFGWRSPVSKEVLSELLDIISEFHHKYTIKCDDGRELSGNQE